MTALRKAADGVDLALCFEAARPCGGLVVARKGMGSGRFVATGRSGHAGIAHDAGVNALTSMARAVVAAEALEARFPGLTVSPGGKVSVRPVALNMIPDHAECEVEWRFESQAVGEAVLAELGRLFGPRALKPEAYYEQDWAAEEFTRGCYGAFLPPGTWTHLGDALLKPVGPLHWAGAEHATRWSGYMDGAVSSGAAAAAAIVAAS